MYGSIEGVKANLPKLAPNIVAAPSDKLHIDEAIVVQYLKEFSAQFDAAAAARYEIPVTGLQSAEIANKVTNDLAAYKLARRFWISIGNQENHELNALRKDAKEILTGLTAGSYRLPDAAVIEADDLSAQLDEILGETEEEFFNMEPSSTWQDKL